MNEPIVQRVVAVVDLSRYSDICSELEQQLGVTSVAAVNDQVRDYITFALAGAGIKSDGLPYKSTGDGAIIALETATQASLFAEKLHRIAEQANLVKTVPLAQRHFRVGVWEGGIIIRTETGRKGQPVSFDYAGTAISNAVRLEGACRTGEVLIGSHVWAELPKPMRMLYGNEEIIKGKRMEEFCAHRRQVTAPASWDTDTHLLSRKSGDKLSGSYQDDLVSTHKRRLAILEKQAAMYGSLTPPHITIEIEDIKRVIADLES